MITHRKLLSAIFLPLAGFAVAFLFLTAQSHAQNFQVDLSSTSGLCGGQECFNADGIFAPGVTFLGTIYLDGASATNCSATPCPDTYSSTALGLSSGNPPTLTPPSLNIPFTFGAVNTSNCSSSPACVLDVVNFTTSGVALTLPAADQTIYSTAVVLGTAVNGSHKGNVTVSYTTGSPTVFALTMSDWCSFGGNPYESIAVGPGHLRTNADGTANGANCSLYAYSLPLDVTRDVQGITMTDADGSGFEYAFAITLKPPTYTIDGGVPNPTSVSPGATSTATVTIVAEPGYGEQSPATINLSCSISPQIVGDPVSAATAPTCSLSPTSVTVSANDTTPPTSTVTFTAAAASTSSLQRPSKIFYALWLPIPAVALVGFGFGSRGSRRKKIVGCLLLGLLAASLVTIPGCVNTVHLGNVGTPPGQYTILVTGVDQNGLTQASNPAGTSNAVIVTVTQ